MNEVLLLGRRAAREVVRMPEATIPTLFIPLFFLVVNIGQVSRTFPSSTAVPARGGLRRLPAAGLADVRRGRDQRAGAGHRHRARVLRQAAGRPGAALVDHRRPLDGRSGAGERRLGAGAAGWHRPGCQRALGSCRGDRDRRPLVHVRRRLRRLRHPHRAAHAQRAGHPVELPALLPAALPDAELRALRSALLTQWSLWQVSPISCDRGVTEGSSSRGGMRGSWRCASASSSPSA